MQTLLSPAEFDFTVNNVETDEKNLNAQLQNVLIALDIDYTLQRSVSGSLLHMTVTNKKDLDYLMFCWHSLNIRGSVSYVNNIFNPAFVLVYKIGAYEFQDLLDFI